MATKKQSAVNTASEVQFTSLKDGAYIQASADFNIRDFANYCLVNIAGFPESTPNESKDQLYEGYQLKYAQKYPAQTYAIINSHYVLASDEHIKNDNVEKLELSVAYVMSFTPQEFGKLKNENPEKHSLIKSLRDSVGVYCSNRKNDLVRMANTILDEKNGKPKTRTANKDFDESITAMFESFDTKVKTAKKRGDVTADDQRYKKAKIAFLAIWKPNA